MWPFNKKITPEGASGPEPVQTVICIPGHWEDWTACMLQIMDANEGEYMAAGSVIMHTTEKFHCMIEFCDHDDRMKDSFRTAGMVTRVSPAFLEEIGRHRHVVYLSGRGGSLEAAEKMARLALALLKAGGIGIKIESSGKAFEKQQWMEFMQFFDASYLYDMFVIDLIMAEDGTVFSCGMFNLGLRDTIASGLAFQEAVDLLRIFGFYQIVDKPVLQEGNTFTATVDAPRFRMITEEHPPYGGHESFNNPFGMWRLSAV